MSQKVRKTLIMIVMAALIICLMAASLTYTFTYGRYAGGKFNSTESPYDDLIEFVGAREYTVRSPEELIQAIKDGYSNIVIAEDAEEPFVITEGVTDVEANLVLNLNGKVVVRNSRNPMLDVQTNVSVVLVYDSKNTGAFYNPVGSSLMASGGSLTVGSGGYESGPRAEEYEGKESAGELGSDTAVTLFARSKETNEGTSPVTSPVDLDRSQYVSGYSLVSGVPSLPEIEPEIKRDVDGNVETVRGNVYLNSGHGDWLPADTFLVYTVEEDCFIGEGTSSGGVTFEEGKLYVDAETETVGDNTTIITASEFTTPLCNVASCDFYYYYPISGTAGTDENPQDYAVIYGYWDVMKLARDDGGAATALKEKGLIWPYAAVRMVEGEGIVRGGTFSNHFDAVNTYGIYAEGGTLSVSKNTTVDTTFTTGGDGVCIRVQSATGEGKATGGSLTISGGEFSSEVGNTIEMSGGKMNVTAGKFTKNASSADTNSTNNGSAIDIQGGTLSMIGTGELTFTITGNYVNGVRVGDLTTSTVTETATIENATFNFNKGEGSNSVAGVRSFGGTLTVRHSTFNISNGATSGKTITRAAGLSTQGGTVTATDCIFNFAQENATVFPTASAGISSLGGTVTATGSTFTIPGNNNYGIYSSITGEGAGEGYDTTATDCTFTMTGNSNHGIYAAGGKTLASGGTYKIGSENGSGQTDNFGIQVSSGSVALAGVTLHVYGEKSSCVYAVGGTISLSGENAVNMHFSSTGTTISSTAISTEGGAIKVTGGSTSVFSDALGITARQKDGNEGSIFIANEAAVTVGAEDSSLRVTGVYVNGGRIENEGTLTVFSTIDGDLSWNESNKYNGVFVNGGSLESTGTLKVTFTGVQNDQNQTDDNDKALTGANAYRLFEIKSYAVRVEGSSDTIVTIAAGEIKNSVGGGVLVNGGKVTLGNSTNNSGPTVQTTGKDVYYTLNGQYIYSGIYDAMNGANDADDGDIQSGGNWRYLLPKTGGAAVKVTNGDLSVYGGSYHALQGDGIVINGGTAEIQSGEFLGQDSYYIQNNYHTEDWWQGGETVFDGASVVTSNIKEPQAGPAASYAFKVYNGTANVYGGTFGSSSSIASGAFVMGTSQNSMGTANIYGGSFVVSSGNTGGQAGFSVYEFGNVVVDPGKGGEQQNLGGEVTMTGLAAGLVIEGNTSNTVSVEIKGGNFSSTRDNGNSDGIWYSNSNATLTISGGTFTGYGRSGLYFAANPGNKVQLSGGTYRGGNNAWYGNSPSNITTGEILTSNAWLYDSGNNPIVYASRSNMNWTYSHLGGNGTSVALNGALSVTAIGGRNDPLSNYKYITITANRVTDSNTLKNAADNRNFG